MKVSFNITKHPTQNTRSLSSSKAKPHTQKKSQCKTIIKLIIIYL